MAGTQDGGAQGAQESLLWANTATGSWREVASSPFSPAGSLKAEAKMTSLKRVLLRRISNTGLHVHVLDIHTNPGMFHAFVFYIC